MTARFIFFFTATLFFSFSNLADSHNFYFDDQSDDSCIADTFSFDHSPLIEDGAGSSPLYLLPEIFRLRRHLTIVNAATKATNIAFKITHLDAYFSRGPPLPQS